MKLCRLRLVVSVMIVAATLLGAASGFAAPPTGHSCVEMSVTDDCPDHAAGQATAPRHCDSLVCGALQLTPPATLAPAAMIEIGLKRQACDDAHRRGQSRPPILRPPIY